MSSWTVMTNKVASEWLYVFSYVKKHPSHLLQVIYIRAFVLFFLFCALFPSYLLPRSPRLKCIGRWEACCFVHCEERRENPLMLITACTEELRLLLRNLISAGAHVCSKGPAFVLILAALRWEEIDGMCVKRCVCVFVSTDGRLLGSLRGPSFFVILPIHHQHLICSLPYIRSISGSRWKERARYTGTI